MKRNYLRRVLVFEEKHLKFSAYYDWTLLSVSKWSITVASITDTHVTVIKQLNLSRLNISCTSSLSFGLRPWETNPTVRREKWTFSRPNCLGSFLLWRTTTAVIAFLQPINIFDTSEFGSSTFQRMEQGSMDKAKIKRDSCCVAVVFRSPMWTNGTRKMFDDSIIALDGMPIFAAWFGFQVKRGRSTYLGQWDVKVYGTWVMAVRTVGMWADAEFARSHNSNTRKRLVINLINMIIAVTVFFGHGRD